MLEPRQLHAASRLLVQMLLDLYDRRNGIACLSKKLQTEGASERAAAMQYPARRGDYSVAPLLLHSWQSAQELIGDVLAESNFAKTLARDRQVFLAQNPRAIRRLLTVLPDQFEVGGIDFMNLAEVVSDTSDLEPVAVRVNHAPPGQIVHRGAPEHRLLAARIHCDVPADAGRICGRGIHREYEAGLLCRGGHATRDDPGLGKYGCYGRTDARQAHRFHIAQSLELLGVDDCRQRRQRHSAPGVTSTAPTRYERKPQLDAVAHQSGNLGLGVRHQHHERILNSPVGGIGNVAGTRIGVETNVVWMRMTSQHPQ